jgi:protocatechuate 3,4-dioxygenase beta subunit
MVEGKDGLTLDGSVSLVSTMVLLDVSGEANPPKAADLGSDETSVLSGTITGSAGGPLDGARVQFCRGTECTSSTTDADGSYRIEGLASGPGSFEVIPNT